MVFAKSAFGAVVDRMGSFIAGSMCLRIGPAMGALLLMAGCVTNMAPASQPASAVTPPDSAASEIILALRHRQSVLPAQTNFGRLSEAVLTQSQSAAEAELQVKRLTAQARAKNWLPQVGPQLSLRSLSDVAAGLVVDNALFDNGKRRFEREFAAADVDAAAVSLSADLNQRVYNGLKLYLEADRALALSQITQSGLGQLSDFERIMSIRLEGGLSDRSEHRVIVQKRVMAEAELAREQLARDAALAELQILAGDVAGPMRGLSAIAPVPVNVPSLAQLQAQAEAARMVAEIRIARTSLMPGLGGALSWQPGGDIAPQADLTGSFLSFGRAEKRAALDKGEDVALRQVEQAQRLAQQRMLSLQQEVVSLEAQKLKDERVLKEMEASMLLFQEQYKSGRRDLLQLASQYEDLLAARRGYASLPYQVAQIRLEIALIQGVLVSGGQI